MVIFKNDGTSVFIDTELPEPEFFKDPTTPEAQEFFRKVEEEDRASQIARMERNYRSCGANRKDLEEAGFDKAWFKNKNQIRLYEVCKSFIDKTVNDDSFNSVLVLNGKPGRGKTFFALSALRLLCGYEKPRLFIRKEILKLDAEGNIIPNEFETVREDANLTDYWKGVYCTSDQLAEAMDQRFKDPKEKSDNKKQVSIYKSAKLLVIDEVGRSNQQEAVERNNLFTIINARMSNYLPTIICSNYHEEGLHQLCGEALWTRIKANGRIFSVDELENMRDPRIQSELKARKKK